MSRAVVLVLVFAACKSYTDASDAPAVTPTNDAGSSPGADAGPAPVDAGALDAASPPGTDRGGEAPVPPGMVRVDAATPFAIDATEVTTTAWQAFAAAHSTFAGVPGIPTACAEESSQVPLICGASTLPNAPQTCVDWCGAAAFCLAAGKRLCGAIDPTTTIASQSDSANPTTARWTHACEMPTLTQKYPYGDGAKATSCNTQESGGKVVDVRSFPTCEGGVPGVFDLSGNAAEWIDACDVVSGDCYVQGGSFGDPVIQARCDSLAGRDPKSYTATVGFRCCADL